MIKDIWHKSSETTDVDNNLIIDGIINQSAKQTGVINTRTKGLKYATRNKNRNTLAIK